MILKAADFQSGEHIADVGSGNGWFDAAIGIFEDSLSFVLEEIDSSFIKNGRLKEALLEYAKIKGRTITCSYNRAIGTEKSTNLPVSSFDKVLLIDTYHHFRYQDEMIKDIFRILRPEGKLIVYEQIAKKEGEIFKACNSLIFTTDEIISSFREGGFQLDTNADFDKPVRKGAKLFVFLKY